MNLLPLGVNRVLPPIVEINSNQSQHPSPFKLPPELKELIPHNAHVVMAYEIGLHGLGVSIPDSAEFIIRIAQRETR